TFVRWSAVSAGLSRPVTFTDPGRTGQVSRDPRNTAAVISKEHIANLPCHVERRQPRAKHAEIKRPTRRRPRFSGIADFVLAPETGEQGHSAQRHPADRVGCERDRHEPPHSDRVTYVLF